ncbi:MAG: hypothetical protein ACLRVT_05360 [Oscillospiraceae bacterium]
MGTCSAPGSVQCAALMQAAGPALSVVTEETQFGGSLELLEDIAGAVPLPVLRRTLSVGEDLKRPGSAAPVLFAHCRLPGPQKLTELYHQALELGPATWRPYSAGAWASASAWAKLVGINNRNILQLELDGGTVETTGALAHLKPQGAFSSARRILTPQDAAAAAASGADAVLVGTAIWKAGDPVLYYRQLSRAVRR